ncbi:MAG TPA: toll/interleukin-1 receptor domain-containing protein, partial [Ktedonobacteraceae bacterium]|nr:toll/interleukin-1 receptor domain-containing protein [Ktedonobacteraceae bacterium]
NTIKISIIYAEADKHYKERLRTHLAPQIRSKLIELWDEDSLSGGTDKLKEVSKHIISSRIILLMVSPDFAASEECYTEMELAMQQRADDKAVVIPIRVRPTDWPGAPFEGLLPLPRDGKPISSLSSSQMDEAWRDVAKDLYNMCEGERKKNA